MEAEVLKMASGYCPNCINLGDCALPMKGWMPVPPGEEVKQMYQEDHHPPWNWRKCSHLLTAEVEKQQAAAMAGKWLERSLSNYNVEAGNKEAYEACMDYAKALHPYSREGLLLWGPVGTGKTHLAVGILKIALQRGLTGTHLKVPDLLEEIRKGYDTGNHTCESRAKNYHLVILDDLGAEKVTEWVREKLYSIIDSRYEGQKPTIITTNCSPAELTERIGERITDRLREMCKVVKVDGKSYRGRQKP